MRILIKIAKENSIGSIVIKDTTQCFITDHIPAHPKTALTVVQKEPFSFNCKSRKRKYRKLPNDIKLLKGTKTLNATQRNTS